MRKYHKIQSIFYRDPATNHKTFIEGKFSEHAFDILQNCPWEFTEKIDGTNIRINWNGNGVRFGGRTDAAQLPGSLFLYLQDHFTDERVSEALQGAGDITLIGEGYGGKIQNMSKVYGEKEKFILFDVFMEPNEMHPLGFWLERQDVEAIAKLLEISCSPILFTNTLMNGYKKLKENPAMAGVVAESGNPIEGLVARPQTELLTRLGSRVICKIKGKDFARA